MGRPAQQPYLRPSLNADAVTRLVVMLSSLHQAVDVMGRQPYEMADSDDVRALLGGPDTR